MSDNPTVDIDSSSVRDALVRQWRLIAVAVPTIDLDVPSRVANWSNRHVLAHLTLQPHLLRHFLESASQQEPAITLSKNLQGTHKLAATIDEAAQQGARDNKIDFLGAMERALPQLLAADLSVSVVTVQGPIALSDYLVTRCVEAVVHGRDFSDPIQPDGQAEQIAAEALLQILNEGSPDLAGDARSLALSEWLDVATGRQLPPPSQRDACPVMT